MDDFTDLPRLCPHCGAMVDGQLAVNDDDQHTGPRPGNVSICLYCSGVSIFTESGLRETTDDEWRSIMDDEDTQRGLAAIAMMRALGQVPPCP